MKQISLEILCEQIGTSSGTALPHISLSKIKSTNQLMASKKAASKSSISSDAYTGSVIHSRSKWIIQEQDQDSVIAQSIIKQLVESSKGEIIIRENPLFDNSTLDSDLLEQELDLEVVSVIMTDVTI